MSLQELADRIDHFGGLGVTAGRFLRVGQLTTSRDFEHTTTRRDEFETVERTLEFVEEGLCHAHGTAGIPSNGAVLN
jgi:hypothetical protein